MSNQRQLVRQTAAVLMACGLIASLLPGCAATQDLSTPEGRATFFVGGANASDTNPGTASQPFATIQKAANVARPGDVVKIRDGVYRETVAPANSGTASEPIVFMADDGAEPVISGANLLTGANWTVHKGNIYKANVTLPAKNSDGEITGTDTLACNQIFVRSKAMPEARYPKMSDPDDPLNINDMIKVNIGQWNITAPVPRTITNSNIPIIPGGWAGGFMHLQYYYLPSTCDIVSDSGTGTLGYVERYLTGTRNNMSYHGKQVGNVLTGALPIYFYLFGKLEALTAENEWFYDGTTLYFWAPGGGVPTDIEYKARNYGFDLTNRAHIELKGLNFFACDIPTNGTSLSSNGAERIVIDGCRFKYLSHFMTYKSNPNSGYYEHQNGDKPPSPTAHTWDGPHINTTGIRLLGDNCVFKNSVVDTAAGSAVFMGGASSIVENNYFTNIGYCGSHSSSAINVSRLKPQTITRNTAKRLGAGAVVYFGRFKEISYNDFSEFTALCVDHGAIQDHNNGEVGSARGTVIHHNWIHDAANPPHPFDLGGGIYCDGGVKGITIHHNVVWGCHHNDIRFAAPDDQLPYRWYNRAYNNTQGSPDGPRISPGFAFSTPEYTNGAFENNIYRSNWNPKNKKPAVRASEVGYNVDPMFIDGSGASGGLGFQLRAGSPAINRGVPVDGRRVSISPHGADLNGAVSGVDDFIGPAPDAGAYEFGKEPWVPGYNLPREFIESQPWERQWGPKRQF